MLNNLYAFCSLRSSDPGPDIDIVEESPEKGADGIYLQLLFVAFFFF